MNHLSKVSVYMPTHNREGMLERAIVSVVNQTYPLIELIVVDDGSEDKTWDRLQSLKQSYPILRVFRHETPRGACAARNTAIQAATGDFITGIDDDDEMYPEHINNFVIKWDDRFSCLSTRLENDNGQTRRIQGKEHGEVSLDDMLHYNRLGNQIYTRTSRLREVDGFDEILPAFQDYDCWVRLIAKFGNAYKLKSATYVLHTEHELNRISSSNSRRMRAFNLFFNKHKSKMNASHRNSFELLKKRIQGEPIKLGDVLQLINSGNYRAAFSAYLSKF